MRSTAEQGREALFPLVADRALFLGRTLCLLAESCPRESAMQAQHAVEVSHTQGRVFDISRTRC